MICVVRPFSAEVTCGYTITVFRMDSCPLMNISQQMLLWYTGLEFTMVKLGLPVSDKLKTTSPGVRVASNWWAAFQCYNSSIVHGSAQLSYLIFLASETNCFLRCDRTRQQNQITAGAENLKSFVLKCPPRWLVLSSARILQLHLISKGWCCSSTATKGGLNFLGSFKLGSCELSRNLCYFQLTNASLHVG